LKGLSQSVARDVAPGLTARRLFNDVLGSHGNPDATEDAPDL
jgi:hypothetical protein